MEQFNIVLKDFVNWKLENVEVLEKFKTNHSLLYDRLEPIYVVLNKIYEQAVEGEELNEDLKTIFQVGLNYLHTQFEVIRIYYEKLFDSDCQLFSKYVPLVGYLMYIYDFRSDLEDYEDSIDFSELNNVETMLENMIAERDDRFEYAAERLNECLDNIVSQLDFEYVSIVDIFVEISENLDVDLSTEESFIVGKDI